MRFDLNMFRGAIQRARNVESEHKEEESPKLWRTHLRREARKNSAGGTREAVCCIPDVREGLEKPVRHFSEPNDVIFRPYDVEHMGQS